MIVIFSIIGFSLCVHAKGEMDNFEITNEVDSAMFEVGYDKGIDLRYIVDRTSKLCFAATKMGAGGGITNIPCKNIMKIPSIKTFYSTGKTPGKKSK